MESSEEFKKERLSKLSQMDHEHVRLQIQGHQQFIGPRYLQSQDMFSFDASQSSTPESISPNGRQHLHRARFEMHSVSTEEL